MKTSLFYLCTSLFLAGSAPVLAQRPTANHPPIIYGVSKGVEKVPLFAQISDTAKGKSGFNLHPGEDVEVVGEYSPRWLVVKREGFMSLAAASMLIAPGGNIKSVPRTEEYCLILASAKFLSTKVTISIDYGQERKIFADNRYKDETGRVQSFNSVIDVLNYQNSQGWEFVNAYTITVGTQNVYHYLMKRRVAQ